MVVLICVAGCEYICMSGVYICSMCVCLLGIQAQPGCWLDVAAWSCYTLMSVRPPNSSTNEEYIIGVHCSDNLFLVSFQKAVRIL